MKKILFLAILAALAITWLPRSCHQICKMTARFDCLPHGVKLDEYVTRSGNQLITVCKKLKELKAHCDSSTLVDGNKREIRFFRPYCGGAVPSRELEKRLRNELEELTKHYTVIVIECHVGMDAVPP
jgi:hypothetical protein